MSLRDQVGQLLMVGMSSSGLSGSVADVLDDTRAGSVILLGNSTAGTTATKRLVSQVRGAANLPGRVKTMLAADQEGGLVQRLKGQGFSTIPSAENQAGLSDLFAQGNEALWGPEAQQALFDFLSEAWGHDAGSGQALRFDAASFDSTADGTAAVPPGSDYLFA